MLGFGLLFRGLLGDGLSSSLPNGHHEWLEACSAGALAGCEEASWVWK